jgi:hypothetical protein
MAHPEADSDADSDSSTDSAGGVVGCTVISRRTANRLAG